MNTQEPAADLEHVRVGEITKFAKSKCRTCSGSGQFVVAPVGGERKATLCGCALRRFMKNRGMETVIKEGQLFWLPAFMPRFTGIPEATGGQVP